MKAESINPVLVFGSVITVLLLLFVFPVVLVVVADLLQAIAMVVMTNNEIPARFKLFFNTYLLNNNGLLILNSKSGVSIINRYYKMVIKIVEFDSLGVVLSKW